MKGIIEMMVRHRNPHFRLHPEVSFRLLFSFAWTYGLGLVRGLKLCFYGKSPKMAILGRSTTFFNSPGIRYGRFMKLGDHVCLSALGKNGIRLGDNVGIGAFSRVIVSTSLDNPGEYISIGNHVGIGEFAYLGGGGGLSIGDECIIGQYFSCHPENHVTSDMNMSIRKQGVIRKGIKIGNNCWIGSKVTVLDGVEIGEGSVIAAGSVVNKSFPAFSVIGGVPAKLLKTRS